MGKSTAPLFLEPLGSPVLVSLEPAKAMRIFVSLVQSGTGILAKQGPSQ
jgi:hypothetical protein